MCWGGATLPLTISFACKLLFVEDWFNLLEGSKDTVLQSKDVLFAKVVSSTRSLTSTSLLSPSDAMGSTSRL